jgi:alpha,alpha-trehalase
MIILLSACEDNTTQKVSGNDSEQKELSNKMPKNILKVREFISENMPKTVRITPKDSASYIGLPKPYSVPCVKDGFQEMYYWDSYFTNIGLIADGNIQQAQNNIDNILFLIKQNNFMPNASHMALLNRSQPPYASMMVRDVYEKTQDKEWLKYACGVLEIEYKEFWMKKRISPNGLNTYGHHATDDYCLRFYNFILKRIPEFDTSMVNSDDDKIRIGGHFLAEAESGWDFNPRFDARCRDFNPVDLNSNLYMYEINFAFFYEELSLDGAEEWLNKADTRKRLMNEFCFDQEKGLFYDYDFVNKQLSEVYSAASLSPLFSGLASSSQANVITSQLNKLEFEYGISACEKENRKYTYQWDFPNAWPCVQYIAIKGLDNYGFKSDAKRVAQKYVDAQLRSFESTSNLWEKHNVEKGDLDVNNEYEMPPFMGWTAGVFIYASDYISK